jgi:PAS domain S-box-containing protein
MVAINIHKPYTRLATQTIEIARSAAELAAQRERLHRMIDTAIDGIITVDEHQTILMINPAAATIFGYDAEYLMGKSLTLLIPERHRAGHGSHLKKFGETGSTRRKMGSHYEDFYITGRRADGTEFPMEASIAHQLENGARIYTVIFRDITDRKIAKEKMAQYHEELSQLSAALQSIREEERKHIARELHDDLGQLLAALRMDLTLVQRAPELAAKSQSAIQSMDQLILTAITTLRRIATDLRPRALDEGDSSLHYKLYNVNFRSGT